MTKTSSNQHDADVKRAVVEGYRALIAYRYTYERLSQRYQLPESFGPENVDQLKNYFLELMYPEYHLRQELEQAFVYLDKHIKHPEQLARIIIDSSRLIFALGRHLPKVLKAGLKALRSFRAAIELENDLIKEAQKSEIGPDIDMDGIKTLLRNLSRKKIDHFIDENLTLFDTLNDRELVAKIIQMVDALIAIMKKHPKTYNIEEIRGLEWGREIIVRGNALFDQFQSQEQEVFFEWVKKIEVDYLDEIYSES